MRRGGYKCRTLKINLQLREKQLKTISYTYRFLYQNFRITANQKSTIDTQIMKNQLKYNPKDSHQTRRGEQEKKERKKEQQKQNQSN